MIGSFEFLDTTASGKSGVRRRPLGQYASYRDASSSNWRSNGRMSASAAGSTAVGRASSSTAPVRASVSSASVTSSRAARISNQRAGWGRIMSRAASAGRSHVAPVLRAAVRSPAPRVRETQTLPPDRAPRDGGIACAALCREYPSDRGFYGIVRRQRIGTGRNHDAALVPGASQVRYLSVRATK